MGTAIPIRNIYLLLCYAYNHLTELGLIDVEATGDTELVDLFARIMITGTGRLRRRGFERGYSEEVEELAGIRGRVRIGETVLRFQDRHGRATCAFDELTVDTPQNRVLKAAMHVLCRVDELNSDYRSALKQLARGLSDVEDRPLTRGLFREVRLHTNNRHYRFLIDVAALIMMCAMPDEASGTYRFRDFSREGPEMARLFEAFVRNFLRIERRDLSIASEDLEWMATSDDEGTLALLPRMRTDITVRSSQKTLVIDTKFYERTFQTYFDKKSVWSGNLYQMLSYLKNMEMRDGPDGSAEGMLLYPTVLEEVDARYQIQGHSVQVRTVNLAKDWRTITENLKALVSF